MILRGESVTALKGFKILLSQLFWIFKLNVFLFEWKDYWIWQREILKHDWLINWSLINRDLVLIKLALITAIWKFEEYFKS